MTMLQLEWAIEYVFMNPLLLQNGLSPKWTSYAFLPSPLAQMVFAPVSYCSPPFYVQVNYYQTIAVTRALQ